MNIDNTPNLPRRLTAAELDDAILRARAHGLHRVPHIPRGCDQQGRHPAEACTDLGSDDGRQPHSTGTTVGLILIGVGVLLWVAFLVHLITTMVAP